MVQRDMVAIQEIAGRLRDNVGRVIIGKDTEVELLLIALLCEGHVLIEDVPGIGKTTLAKALARSLGCVFQRVQFTPDLLPSDITGISVYDQRTGKFEYRPGPLMAQVVLADEINRAGPRTQSALLEAMEERQMTVDGITHPLPRPFIVLATQNPVELEGTFPLPEAQVDRFFMRIGMGYPSEEEEGAILRRFREASPLAGLQPAIDGTEIIALQAAVRRITVQAAVETYLLRITRATRSHDGVQLGVSPRGTMALYRASQARAALHGRDYVLPDDVKALLHPVLNHRLLLTSRARLSGRPTDAILDEIASSVPVPVEETWSLESEASPAAPGKDEP